jgi:hypothetical protein
MTEERLKHIEEMLFEIRDAQFVLMDMLNTEVVEFDAEDDQLSAYEFHYDS